MEVENAPGRRTAVRRPEAGRPSPRGASGPWKRLVAFSHHPLFDLALTLLIIVGLLGSFYAYTENWPPLVVVESSSMQHGPGDVLGVINAGDLVLVKRVDVPGAVTTYVQGEASGLTSYGEYGNVILYAPNGDRSTTPVIHRAILWLEWNSTYRKFVVPSLSDLSCHADYLWFPGGNSSGEGYCPASPSSMITGYLELLHVGWQSVKVQIDLRLLENDSAHSGFLTMGDNNFGGGLGDFDQSGDCLAGISCLVEPGWVEGIAQGMIPWIGSLKLLFTPDAQNVPAGSWDGLVLVVLVLIVVVGFGPRLFERRRPPRAGRPRRAPEHWVEPEGEEESAGGEGPPGQAPPGPEPVDAPGSEGGAPRLF